MAEGDADLDQHIARVVDSLAESSAAPTIDKPLSMQWSTPALSWSLTRASPNTSPSW